ncbi:hypothetical protein BDV38DRAFT_244027 [Aspergillus pseudotamarii]|uniref:Caspase domain-containing protein n=1 Tax=Aspergillus pseudotamarii TaxID=132259 RepID=A0A5N6T076_ASPPS|nr:uncharacterized protein BDV38DRAFT_244027 [Aspergillus pseudotamarii]KAE8138854.1 hypothetical protein BDV38DRAFT_244027 [Aspergillus pseudotamarii]
MEPSRMTRAVHSLTHQASFRDAVNSIQQAVKDALPSKKGYDSVCVLTLRWANDDLGLADIEKELLKFFSVGYHYATDSILMSSLSIPDALDDIRERIGKLIAKYDTPTSLFIIVYEGHSSISPAGFSIFGTTRGNPPTLLWAHVDAELLRIRLADKLVILDSCFSTAAALGGGNNEYLAASSFESEASGCVERSFTRRLLDLLGNLNCPEITVAQLHAKLVKQANNRHSELDYTPVHISHMNKPSITLRPLDKMPREVAALRMTGELADGKVLISVLLDGKSSIPKIGDWKKWLMTSIPEAVADIKIEAVFESTSSLCLVTMPVAVWDMLKKNDAYDFVAYVESHNLLLHQPGPSSILEGRAGNVQLPTREK